MPKRIIDLSETEFHRRCLRDARGVFELSEHLTMCAEDGFPPEKMSVAEIIEEAREALSYYEDGGLAAEECDRATNGRCRTAAKCVRSFASGSRG